MTEATKDEQIAALKARIAELEATQSDEWFDPVFLAKTITDMASREPAPRISMDEDNRQGATLTLAQDDYGFVYVDHNIEVMAVNVQDLIRFVDALSPTGRVEWNSSWGCTP